MGNLKNKIMGRIIINNKSDLPDLEIVNRVYEVIKLGRISNDGKQYCYLCTFKKEDNEYQIASDLRKGSDSFTIHKTN